MRTFAAFSFAMLVTMTTTGCAVRAQAGDPYSYPPEDGYAADGGYDERPGYDPEVEAGDYDRPLRSYGEWVDDRTYGRIWHPHVDVGWSPYTDGSWGWSRWGWTFASPVPWGWTYHYGRWVYASSYGWSWYPGTVWGPAWVDWYWGDGYVGWAPLAPFGVVSVNHYVFVDERRFCSPHVRGYVRYDRDLPDGVRRNVYDRRIVRPPDHDHIARVSRDPVQRFDRRGPRGGDGDDRRIVRPRDGDGRRPDGGRIDRDRPRRVERPDDATRGRYTQPGRPWNGDDDRRQPRRVERFGDDGGRQRVDRGGGADDGDRRQPRRIERFGDDGGRQRIDRGGGPDDGDQRRRVYRPPVTTAAPRVEVPRVDGPRRIERPGVPRAEYQERGRTAYRTPPVERDGRPRTIQRAPAYRGGGDGPPAAYRRGEPAPQFRGGVQPGGGQPGGGQPGGGGRGPVEARGGGDGGDHQGRNIMRR